MKRKLKPGEECNNKVCACHADAKTRWREEVSEITNLRAENKRLQQELKEWADNTYTKTDVAWTAARKQIVDLEAKLAAVTIDWKTANTKWLALMKDSEVLHADMKRLERELNAFMPDADDEGACLRCGLSWEGEKNADGEHLCPPGFWNLYEKRIEVLERQLAEQMKGIEQQKLINEITRLRAELEAYKRLYNLRGKALMRPCLQCGYQPKKITLADGSTEESND